ncbi:hypothetical protein ACIGGE_12365 [Qipengyuania sp. NPDC077410]|uniref:hypothetical protein n=1 Tax=Qipengyuania sp. NPDC077410 TaxID=3364496 RepID=UPI0037C735CF
MDRVDKGPDYLAEAEQEEDETEGAEGKLKTPKKSQKTRKALPKGERERRQKMRLANQFPNGPEARELKDMAKPMPTSLREKIRKGGKYELWSEAFGWLAADLQRKARNGTQFYPKLVVKKLRAAYPDLHLHGDEVSWLEGWIDYLGKFRTNLRSGGSYGPGIDLLVALDVERDVYGEIDSLDIVPDGGKKQKAPAPELTMPSIDDLPPIPREPPFRFMELKSAKAKTFWRAYWKSNDIDAIREAGFVLSSDREARNEMERLGEKAETFFIQTMAKLGIPLS